MLCASKFTQWHCFNPSHTLKNSKRLLSVGSKHMRCTVIFNSVASYSYPVELGLNLSWSSSHRAFATSISRSALPYQQPETSTSLSAFPHPQFMDSRLLAHCTFVAAKDNVQNTTFWNLVIIRAKQIVEEFFPKDAVLVLISLSKTRFFDKALCDSLAFRLTPHLNQLTATELSKVLSAFSKTNTFNERFISAFLKELSNRVEEFTQPLDFAMLLNSLSKLQAYDKVVFSRLSRQLLLQLRLKPFHVRELSVITSAYANVHHYEEPVFSHIGDRLPDTLRDATPTEIARLLQAFLQFDHPITSWYNTALRYTMVSINLMGPSEICSTAFAFGKVKEVLSATSSHKLDEVFDELRDRFLGVLSSASLSHICSFLHTFCRWLIVIELKHLIVLTNHLDEKYDVMLMVDELQLQIMHSLVSLLSQSIGTAHNSEDIAAIRREYAAIIAVTENLFLKWIRLLKEKHLKAALENSSIIRVIGVIASSKWLSPLILNELREFIVLRHHELDARSASALYSIFSDLGLNEEDDFMEGLLDKMNEVEHKTQNMF